MFLFIADNLDADNGLTIDKRGHCRKKPAVFFNVFSV